MSPFGRKADMTFRGSPPLRSLLGAKRTCFDALHMSAFDPKRTQSGPQMGFVTKPAFGADMRRRHFITLVGSLAAWPVATLAQPKRSARLGALLYSDPDPQMSAVRRALRTLGYVEGQNIAIEYRYAEGQLGRLPVLAAQLVVLQPDVILAI